MSALVPPYNYGQSSAYGIDRIVNIIQYALAQEVNGLGYLNALGRIKPTLVGGKLQPWIVKDKEKGEHYVAFPNDKLLSLGGQIFSGILAHDDESYDEDNIYVERTMSVIVCLNTKRPSGDLNIEQVKYQVRQMLGNLYCVHSITKSVDQTAGGMNGVYPGFDLSGIDEKFMTAPYWAFRIEFIVKYADTCY